MLFRLQGKQPFKCSVFLALAGPFWGLLLDLQVAHLSSPPLHCSAGRRVLMGKGGGVCSADGQAMCRQQDSLILFNYKESH